MNCKLVLMFQSLRVRTRRATTAVNSPNARVCQTIRNRTRASVAPAIWTRTRMRCRVVCASRVCVPFTHFALSVPTETRYCASTANNDCAPAAVCAETNDAAHYRCSCRDGYLDMSDDKAKPGRKCVEREFCAILHDCVLPAQLLTNAWTRG
jgi:hypothetical protein